MEPRRGVRQGGARRSSAPDGAARWAVAVPGLTPWATFFCPCGAEEPAAQVSHKLAHHLLRVMPHSPPFAGLCQEFCICGTGLATLREGPRSDAVCGPTLRGGALRRGATVYIRWLKCYQIASASCLARSFAD